MLQVWHLQDKAGTLSIPSNVCGPQEQVTCISFSPLIADVLVAGHTGGVIAVYSLKSSKPLLVTQVSFICTCVFAVSPGRSMDCAFSNLTPLPQISSSCGTWSTKQTDIAYKHAHKSVVTPGVG